MYEERFLSLLLVERDGACGSITMSCVSQYLEAVFAHESIHHFIHPQIFIKHLLCPGTDLSTGDITMNKVGKFSALMGLTSY